MYVLAEALKKLRVVDAKLNPEEFNCIKELYRGMADMQVDAEMIQRLGGTELAPVCALSCIVLHCVALCCTVYRLRYAPSLTLCCTVSHCVQAPVCALCYIVLQCVVVCAG